MPNNWKTYKLTELVENIVDNRGKTCPTDVTGIPLIATNCIRNEKLYPDFINVRYVSDETYNNWFRAHPKPDDMLFVLKGTPGRVCWTPNPINFCIAQDMVALRAKKDIIYPKYLFALLRSKIAQDKINALHVGSLIPHFKKTDFDKLELPVFEDINYQKEIGNIYFDICDKIENNLAINKTLEEMAMALYKHWFVDFGPFQDGEFVESELGRIPKGWEVRKIGEVIETLGGGTPSTTIKEYWEDGDILWYSPTDLTRENSLFSFDTAKKITALGLQKSSAKMFPANSLLMSSRATIGLLTINTKEACTNQGFITMLPNDKLTVYQLYFWLKDNMDLIVSKANGSTFKEISKSNFRDLEIVIPNSIESYIEQTKDIFEQIKNNTSENQTLTQLRDTLLPKLISGAVRLKEFRESITN